MALGTVARQAGALLGAGQPAAFGELFAAVDALLKRAKPGSPQFVAEFTKICERCDIVPIGAAPM